MARVPGAERNIIDQPLYDTAAIANNATSASFFSTPQGQGTSAFTGVKTLADTNMTVAGMLPSPQAMVVKAIAFSLAPNVTHADAFAILRSGFVEFIVGAKPFLQCPLEYITGGMGIVAGGAARTDAASTEVMQFTNGVADPRAVRVLTQPIPLGSNENFQFTIKWPVAITIGTTTPVRVYFLGDFIRSVQ